MENVILWDNVTVADNVTLKNVVCANNTSINSSLEGTSRWEVVGPDKIIECSNV